jgi:hypothetical protein
MPEVWQEDPPMLQGQSLSTAANVGAHIYVLSGPQEGIINLQHFDVKSSAWNYLSPLLITQKGRRQGTVAFMLALNESLYAVGGPNTVCAQYNIITDSWKLLSQALRCHSFGSAACHADTIYVFGGGSSYNRNVEEYDVVNDEWKESEIKLPLGLWFHSTAPMSYPFRG